MYFRKVRLNHCPNFIIRVSIFPDNLSAIAPPSQRECVSNICVMISCFSSPRAQTYALTVMLVCRGYITDFVPLVYTTTIL